MSRSTRVTWATGVTRWTGGITAARSSCGLGRRRSRTARRPRRAGLSTRSCPSRHRGMRPAPGKPVASTLEPVWSGPGRRNSVPPLGKALRAADAMADARVAAILLKTVQDREPHGARKPKHSGKSPPGTGRTGRWISCAAGRHPGDRRPAGSRGPACGSGPVRRPVTRRGGVPRPGRRLRRTAARPAGPAAARAGRLVTLPAGGCTCDLCATLREFLAAPDRRMLEWPLAKQRRQHVHTRIDAGHDGQASWFRSHSSTCRSRNRRYRPTR
jgi:hypothetical protein